MSENNNSLSIVVAHAADVLSVQPVSLVARGLAAVQNSTNSISQQSKIEKLESLLKSLTPATRIAVLNAALEQKIERTQNDSLYRQARDTFDGKDEIRNWNVGSKKGNNREWNEAKNPTMYSAFKILQQLSNENYGKAYYPLAILYSGRRDIEDGHIHAGYYMHLAFNWCMENQANIDGELWCDLGDMHYPWTVNYGVTYSREIAGAYYRKAAEQGYARGQWEFGNMYQCGSVVEQNYQQAAYWYRKAAEQDNSGFQYDLGKMYFHGGNVVEQNYQQAMYWFRKAAEQGDFRGIRSLGIMYKYGMGVPKDETEAAKWIQMSAEQGDSDIQNNLGAMSNQLDKLPQNLRKEVINLVASKIVLERIKQAKLSLNDNQNMHTINTEKSSESDPIEVAMNQIQHRREQEMQGMTEQELKEYMINELLAQDRMLDQMEEVEAANKTKYSPKA